MTFSDIPSQHYLKWLIAKIISTKKKKSQQQKQQQQQ